MDTSTQVDLLAERSTDFDQTFTFVNNKKEPVDITCYKPYMFIKEGGHQDIELQLNLDYGLSICNADSVRIFITCEQLRNQISWRTGHYQIVLVNKYSKKIPFLRGTLTIK